MQMGLDIMFEAMLIVNNELRKCLKVNIFKILKDIEGNE